MSSHDPASYTVCNTSPLERQFWSEFPRKDTCCGLTPNSEMELSFSSEGYTIGHPKRSHFNMWIILSSRQLRPSNLRKNFYLSLNTYKNLGRGPVPGKELLSEIIFFCCNCLFGVCLVLGFFLFVFCFIRFSFNLKDLAAWLSSSHLPVKRPPAF